MMAAVACFHHELFLLQMCMAETAMKEIVGALKMFPKDALIQCNGLMALGYMLQVKSASLQLQHQL